MNLVFRLTALALTASLAACASLEPAQMPEKAPSTERKAPAAAQADEAWGSPSLVTEGRPAVVLFTPQTLPQSVRARPLELSLDPGTTVQDVVAVLGEVGIPAILASEEAGQRKFYLPRFKGEVGTFLSAVSHATDTWFTWHEGAVVVSTVEKIGVTIPQDQTFADAIDKGLASIGIKDKSVQWHAGMAIVEMTPAQFRRTTAFLERMTANAAVVSLQVAVVNVTLNHEAKLGIDWDKLQVSAVRGGTFPQYFAAREAWDKATTPDVPTPTVPVPDTSGGTTPTPGSGSGSTTNPTPLPTNTLSALMWAGNALQGAIFGERFNLQGLFNFLQTYGDAETKQSVTLKTMTGSKVELKSLTQIPYVEEIGSSTTQGGTTATTTGSTKTAKADDGITLELTPTYDAAANTVTVNLNLSLKAVVAFNELSVGNQLGTITQPTTADRSFTDTVLLRPGQTVVVGGLTYDSVSSNKSGPVFLGLQSKLNNQSLKVNRQSMFIVLRPTVIRLGALQAKSMDGLNFLPAAPNPAPSLALDEPHPAPAEPTKDEPVAAGAHQRDSGKASTTKPQARLPARNTKAATQGKREPAKTEPDMPYAAPENGDDAPTPAHPEASVETRTPTPSTE